MARPTTKLKIEKRDFVITHWSPRDFLNKGATISKFIAVPAGMTLGSMIGDQLKQEDLTSGSGLGDAVMWLFSNLEGDQASDLMEFILSDVSLDGEAVNLDEDFAEDPSEMFDVAAKVLEVNYAPFFKKKGFGNLLSKMSNLRSVMETFRQA